MHERGCVGNVIASSGLVYCVYSFQTPGHSGTSTIHLEPRAWESMFLIKDIGYLEKKIYMG